MVVAPVLISLLGICVDQNLPLSLARARRNGDQIGQPGVPRFEKREGFSLTKKPRLSRCSLDRERRANACDFLGGGRQPGKTTVPLRTARDAPAAGRQGLRVSDATSTTMKERELFDIRRQDPACCF